jgi:hypothetical protein
MPSMKEGKAYLKETIKPWPIADDFRNYGFVEVYATAFTSSEWIEVHRWSKEQFADRYTWCGHNFFFETEADALKFSIYCT